jgi:hypothetical protein
MVTAVYLRSSFKESKKEQQQKDSNSSSSCLWVDLNEIPSKLRRAQNASSEYQIKLQQSWSKQ